MTVSLSGSVVAMEQSSGRAKDTGVRAREVGDSLASITNAVETILQMNVQIATAAEQQTSVAEEIDRNVINIQDGTKSNKKANSL